MAADIKRKAETKKSLGLTGLPEDSIKNIYQYLSGHELVEMQVVGADAKRNEWRYVQEEVKRRALEIPDIKEEERGNVWRIYECFRGLTLADDSEYPPYTKIPPLPIPTDRYSSLRGKCWLHELTAQEVALLARDNLLPDTFNLSQKETPVPIPLLPKPPADIWANLRNKRIFGELSLEEIRLLSNEGLFSGSIAHIISKLPPIPVDIYESMRNKLQFDQLTAAEVQWLERRNLLAHFPELPAPPIDPWATIRTKQTWRELTLSEIHLLFTNNLLDKDLHRLCRSRYEKFSIHEVYDGRSCCDRASLVMETPFLRSHLPADQLIRTCPDWIDKILSFFLTPIFSMFLASFIGSICVYISLVMLAGLTAFAAIYTFLIFPLRCIYLLLTCQLECEKEYQTIKYICSLPLYPFTAILDFIIFYPYCFFAGFYTAWKYGSGSLDIMTRFAGEPFDSSSSYGSEGFFPFHRIFSMYRVSYVLKNGTIADIASEADRETERDEIYKFQIREIPPPLTESKNASSIKADNKSFTPSARLLGSGPDSEGVAMDYKSFGE